MKLANLLRPITYSIRQGNDDLEIGKITHHSREAEKDTLFVCIKDGRSILRSGGSGKRSGCYFIGQRGRSTERNHIDFS